MALSRALMTTQGPDGQMPQGQGQGPLPAPMQGQRVEALPGQGAADDPGVIGQAAVAGQAAVPLTQAQRTAMLLQGQLSGNPGVARVAEFANRQDEVARLQAERIDDRAFQAEQGRLQRAALAAAAAAQGQPARDEQARLIEQDKQYRGQAVAFATRYQNATPDEQKKLLIEAQFSANPYLTKGAAHIGDLAAKVDASRTTADAKAQAVTPAVNNQYTEQLAGYKTAGRTVGGIVKNMELLDSGVLQFNKVDNATDWLRNFSGLTSDQSEAKASYISDMQRLVNDTLQLAKGTQTEGDAIRAGKTILGNLNNPNLVRTQLEKLFQIAADNQNTAATSLNIAGKAYPGLGHEPVAMSRAMPDRPKPVDPPQPRALPGAGLPSPRPAGAAPSGTGPGTQNSPIVVSRVADALLLPPGTWIRRPDGSIGQVPAR